MSIWRDPEVEAELALLKAELKCSSSKNSLGKAGFNLGDLETVLQLDLLHSSRVGRSHPGAVE